MKTSVVCVATFLSALTPARVPAQDTLTVEVAATPEWGPDLELVEELRLGAVEGAPHLTWGRVAGFAADPQGFVYVADGTVPAIYQFSASGDYLGPVGREGEGPGEYRTINGLALGPRGQLFVQDVPGGRITVYGPDRDVLREFRFEGEHQSNSGTFQVDGYGNSYVRTPRRLLGPLTPTQARYPPYDWVRRDSTGRVIDTIHAPAAEPEGPHYTLITSEGARHPFTVLNVSTLSSAGYLVWGRNDRYALYRTLADGSVVELVLSRPRIAVTHGEKTQWEAQSERFGSSLVGEEYPPIPESKPHFRNVWSDAEGRLWVQRYVEPFEYTHSADELAERGARPPYLWREPQVFDVIDPRGRLLGVIRLPLRSQFLGARAQHMWVLYLGDYDVRYVVRYRIRASLSPE